MLQNVSAKLLVKLVKFNLFANKYRSNANKPNSTTKPL